MPEPLTAQTALDPLDETLSDLPHLPANPNDVHLAARRAAARCRAHDLLVSAKAIAFKGDGDGAAYLEDEAERYLDEIARIDARRTAGAGS